jgi:type I restriction enzyme S subunit
MELIAEEVKFERYPAYKDSGVEWLGEVPEHWELLKSKFIWQEIIDLSDNEEETLLSVSQYTGVNLNGDKARGESLIGYKRVDKNDLVINIMLAWLGGLGLSSYKGIVSPAYAVYRLKINFSPNFLHYLYRTNLYLDEFARRSKGIVPSRWRMYTEDFGQVLTVCPPLFEQISIANFLDCKTTQIDQVIAQKEKQIELLKERRQVLIHKAVTRGLNPDVALKDSGVEWIGAIPAHWEVKSAKYLFDEIDDRSKTGNEELLSVSHLTGVTPRSEKNVTMFEAEDYTGSKLCKKGDLVYNIMWAWMGALGVSDRTGIVSPSYAVYRQKNKSSFDSLFLEYILKDVDYVAQYNRVSTGLHTSRLRFYSNMFFSMKIGFPPKAEQDQIIIHLNKVNLKIFKTINYNKQCRNR